MAVSATSQKSNAALKRERQQTTAWIVVLAIAITCCSILFVIFANYLVAINRNMDAANARLVAMEQTESKMLTEIVALRHAVAPKPVPHPDKGGKPSETAD